MSFFAELKRRNVFRVGIAYAIVAWVMLQIAETTFPHLNLPDWSVTLLIVLVAAGFPIALIFAWAFEITPEGLKREKDVDRSQSITDRTGRKLDFVIIGVLAGAVVYFALDKFFLTPLAVTDNAPVLATAEKSIAVLPFTNMSSDEENEFFADGLSEELLNVLARIDGLKVAGRTSSFYFKGKNEDLRKIGETLGVEHILEGSVRKSGNNVRVTAQLIKADDGFHIWSDTYDRQLNDIFAIQDDISSSVASALRVALLGQAEPVAGQAAVDPGIYSRFISARARIASRKSDNLIKAYEMLEGITGDAPDYGPAWAALGVAAILRWANDATLTVAEAMPVAERTIGRALRLAPEDDYVQAANGLLQRNLFYFHDDPELLNAANNAFRRAIELNPENVEAMYWLAINLIDVEEFDEAEQLLDRALSIDPLARVARGRRIDVYGQRGQFDQAIALARQSMALQPEVWFYPTWAAEAEFSRGRPDRALLWLLESEGVMEERHVALARYTLRASYHLDYRAGIDQALADLGALGQPEVGELMAFTDQHDFAGARAVLEDAAERDGFADWESELLAANILAGDCDRAMQMETVFRIKSSLSGADPRVDNTNDGTAIWVAYCYTQQGKGPDAERLLRAALEHFAPKPGRNDGPWQHINRILALSLLGELELAIAEFRAYYDAGFGQTWYNDFPIPFDRDPRFASLHENPEFMEIMAAIRVRNEERLAKVLSGETTTDSPL